MKSVLINKTTKNNFFNYLMVIVVYAFVQILIAGDNLSSLLEGLLVPICTYVILAVSLNLTVGILGELSLGHAGFMCVGAFAGAFFSAVTKDKIDADWLRFMIAIIIGGLVAAVFGFLIGIPVLRLRGDYLAIVTLAFGEIIKNVINALYVGLDSNGFHFSFESVSGLNMESTGNVIVNGAMGITGTPNDSTFTVGIILVLVALFVVQNIINSRTGRAIMSIRDNRIAAESIGINVTKYKLIAFAASAFLAGLAGVLYAHNLSTLTATPQNFGYNMSITILVFVVLGGIGNIRGSIIAAVVLTVLPEVLRELNDYRMLIYSIVLILMMIFTSDPKLVQLREKLFSFAKKKKEVVE